MTELNELMVTDALWDSEKAANFFCVEPKYFNSSIKVMPNFPKPTKIPSARSIKLESKELWIPRDIKKYFYSYYSSSNGT